MARNPAQTKPASIAKFALPGFALAALAGAALAAQSNDAPSNDVSVYETPLKRLQIETAADHATALFQRADLNDDGVLNELEYQALAVVTAELARLNGFVSVMVDGGVRTVALSREPLAPLSGADRTRIEAIAFRDFQLAAGADNAISEGEFVQETLERFHNADRNRNGVLAKSEIKVFAANAARLPQTSA